MHIHVYVYTYAYIYIHTHIYIYTYSYLSHLNCLNSVWYWTYRIWLVASKKMWTSWQRGWIYWIWFVTSKKYEHQDWKGKQFSPHIQPFSKCVTDLLARISESFEPLKSWENNASNHQKNLTKYSSLQPSSNDECHARSRIVFPTPIPKFFSQMSFKNSFWPTTSSFWYSSNITLCFWNEFIYSQKCMN